MLPDLRIVIAAVVSTFILTVGVGFFASSRLIQEQMTARVDTKGHDDTPINRIALNWPEPTKFEPHINLDFAVSAKAAKNPVRDVTPEIIPAPHMAKTDAAAPVPPPSESPAPAHETPAALSQSHETPAALVQEPTTSAPASSAVTQDIAAPAAESSAPKSSVAAQESVTSAADAVTATPDPAAFAAEKEKDIVGEPAPAASVAKAPDPVEEPPAAAVEAPASKTDMQVVVYLHETALAESTGSIAAPAAQMPDVPLPASRPKLALQHEPGNAGNASRPAQTEPARAPVSEKKRPRRAAIRARPAPRPQPQPAQAPQMQPFDFFGLFRNSQAAQRLPAQVAKPTTPIN